MSLAVSKDELCFVKQRENQIVVTVGALLHYMHVKLFVRVSSVALAAINCGSASPLSLRAVLPLVVCKYWFWFLRFIFCWVTLPGTYAGHSALTWGKPAFSHLGFLCPSVVSFSPVGVLWISFVFLVFIFSPHSLWCPFLFGVGVLPLFFPVFTGFSL